MADSAALLVDDVRQMVGREAVDGRSRGCCHREVRGN